MKRNFLGAFMTLALAATGWSTGSTYTIEGNQTVPVPPMVDATNFVNYGVLSIATTAPFEFSNVQNFTNRNLMQNSSGFGGFAGFNSGFRFDNAPSGAGIRKAARSFYNAPSVPSGSATISGGSIISVWATNIVNRGLLQVDTSGLINLDGQKVDVSRSQVTVSTASGSEGITDRYWFLGVNRLTPAFNFVEQYPNTPPYRVIYPPNFTNFTSISLADFGFGPTNTLTGVEFINEAGTNRTVQIVFVRNINSNITVQVESSGGTPNDVGIVTVQWSSVYTNTSSQEATNSLYLTDTYGFNTTNIYINKNGTLQPANFSLSRSGFFGFGDPGVPFTDKDPDFWGTPATVTNAQYSAWGPQISGGTSVQTGVGPRLSGGRVEINASQVLDLGLSRVDAYGYMRLNGTNHFAGAANSTVAISTPYADIALGSTNGNMVIKSLLAGSVPRFVGTIDVFSAVWTNNVDFGGGTNAVLFNVILVDSSMTESVPPQVMDLSLRSTNLTVGDPFNVVSNLVLDTDHLTISDGGGFTLTEPTDWSASGRHIKTLTNQGTIFSVADLSFTALGANNAQVPYRTFNNSTSGLIEGASVMVYATNIINAGSLYSDYGPLQLTAITDVTLEDGGLLSALYADITINCKNLNVTNHFLDVGRSITLSVSGSLKAGANAWLVYDGFNLLTKPLTGDLWEVSVYNTAIEYQESISAWAGQDYGPVDSGFTNNAALGALYLDGGTYSLFTFVGATAGSNALYVDVLYLLNEATNRDAGGNLTAINLTPGMKLYFGQAFIDDGDGNLTDITGELNGKNGGSLGYVDHTGPLSEAPLKPVVSFSPSLQVTVEKTPQARSLVTWTSVPNGTNYLYCTGHPYGGTWQLVTNFVSGPTGGPVTVTDQGLSNSRFFKVRVDVPGQ